MVQGFLTAVRQEVTRRHAADKWALDDVVLSSEVTHPAKDVEGLKDQPNEGVYVYGLYIDGCSWSGKDNRLVDSEPKRLYHPLPVIHVTGVQVSLPACCIAVSTSCFSHHLSHRMTMKQHGQALSNSYLLSSTYPYAGAAGQG